MTSSINNLEIYLQYVEFLVSPPETCLKRLLVAVALLLSFFVECFQGSKKRRKKTHNRRRWIVFKRKTCVSA